MYRVKTDHSERIWNQLNCTKFKKLTHRNCEEEIFVQFHWSVRISVQSILPLYVETEFYLFFTNDGALNVTETTVCCFSHNFYFWQLCFILFTRSTQRRCLINRCLIIMFFTVDSFNICDEFSGCPKRNSHQFDARLSTSFFKLFINPSCLMS